MGQRAWGRIKATAAEQRQIWREVGEALEVGKAMNKRSYMGQKFSEWCQEIFPGIDANVEVPAAIWFATKFHVEHEKELPPALAYPNEIRRWDNDRQAAAATHLTTTTKPSESPEVVKTSLAGVLSPNVSPRTYPSLHTLWVDC